MKRQDVHLFVFDGLSDWEPCYAVAGINSPQFQRQPDRFQVRTVGVRKECITTMGGLRILPDATLDDIAPDASAMLILPGGPAWDQGAYGAVAALAGRFLEAGVPVAAICGATAGLARAGLLDRRAHTSNAREYLAATGYHGAALYEDAPAVTGDKVITASGVAPLEFALHIFRCLDLYAPPVLDAWYNLFKTQRLEFFQQLVQAAGGE